MTVPEALDSLPRRLTGWAVDRYLAPISVSGISLALGLCAAVWFSAGTRPDSVSGALALCGSYLAVRVPEFVLRPILAITLVIVGGRLVF